MKKIIQSKLHDPPFQHGNCWAACIASITEIPLEELPEINDFDYETGWSDFYVAMLLHLEKEGWSLTHMKIAEFKENGEPCIASGKSPRGDFGHAVVWHGGIIHDPHPDGTGIESIGLIERIERIK